MLLIITDRFSRRADMFAVTAAEFTAEGTANILVNQYIPPVSYTHLRAHETLRYLVCRLLLEKPSVEKPTTDCPLANRLHASPGRS